MSDKSYPGPYYNSSNVSRDDAIFATNTCNSPHGSGQINYVNPAHGNQQIQNANNAAITAAYNAGGNPDLSPGYVPPQALADACNGWNTWWAQTHGKEGDKKHKGNDPSKKHQ